MGRIPDEIIQRVRDRVDMVATVGRFVTLKKSGRNFKGLCPFHDEKTPSFHVNPERQSFHCFGCQAGGNAFTFLMEMENLTFPEAVRVLAREYGIDIPESGGGDGGVTERIFLALEAAQEFYRRGLEVPGNPGAVYLAERGIGASTIDELVSASLRTRGAASPISCARRRSRPRSVSGRACWQSAAPAAVTIACAVV